MNTSKVTFKNKEYKIINTFDVPANLAAEGLEAQMLIVGQRGATRLLQIINTKYGKIYKTISSTARVEVEYR